MTQHKNFFRPYLLAGTIAACGLAMPIQANAASFYLQQQSTSALGSAFAGASSQARDASILYYNASGITQLDEGQIYAGAGFLWARSDVSDAGSTLGGFAIGGANGDDATPYTTIPHLYAAYPVYEDTVWLGLAVTAPFGLSVDYDNDWFGRYDSIDTSIVTTDIQPTVAVKVNHWLSLGAGINFQYVNASTSKAVTDGVVEGRAKVKGTDWSTGYNIGATIKPSETTTIGVNYRSKMDHTLDGSVSIAGGTAFDEYSGVTADLDLPSVLSFGVSQKVNDRWTLLGQANRIGWNSFEKLTVVRDNGSVADEVIYDYDTAWAFSVGAEYQWDEDLTLRFGYQHDQTPTNDTHRNTQTFDGNRNMVAVGLTYAVNDRLAIDFSANYAMIDDESVNVSRNLGLANVSASRDNTDYGFISTGLTYKF